MFLRGTGIANPSTYLAMLSPLEFSAVRPLFLFLAKLVQELRVRVAQPSKIFRLTLGQVADVRAQEGGYREFVRLRAALEALPLRCEELFRFEPALVSAAHRGSQVDDAQRDREVAVLGKAVPEGGAVVRDDRERFQLVQFLPQVFPLVLMAKTEDHQGPDSQRRACEAGRDRSAHASPPLRSINPSFLMEYEPESDACARLSGPEMKTGPPVKRAPLKMVAGAS